MADTGDLRVLSIGSETFYPYYTADGRPFHFNAFQNQFLIAHQKTKNIEIAAQMVGKDRDWALRFINSKKFKGFVSATMTGASQRSGMTVDWWYQFGKWCSDGYREHYEYRCTAETCNFTNTVNTHDAESLRNDDNQIEMICQACFKPVTLKRVEVPFKPTREQIESWKEVGSRILPKVERVHHQFEESTIIFESEEAK